MGVVIQPRESDVGREDGAESIAKSKPAIADGVFAQGIVRAIMELSNGRLGAKVFRELEGVSQVAAAQALRRLFKADRKTLGRDSRLQQARKQSFFRICGRAQ